MDKAVMLLAAMPAHSAGIAERRKCRPICGAVLQGAAQELHTEILAEW